MSRIQRQLVTDPFTKVMIAGTTKISMNSRVSHIISPMRNTDIKKAEKTGDWSALMEKALINTRRFRREFYA